MPFVYYIENLINNKAYIGKTTHKYVRYRWNEHIKIAIGGKEKYPKCFSVIHAAISKYGVSNFNFGLLSCCESPDDAILFEKFWIKHLKSIGIILYNLTDGGDGLSGRVFTEEHKKKLSEAHRGKKATLAARLKMGASRKFEFSGEKNNHAKINESQVREIRRLSSLGHSNIELAKKFDLTSGTISKIINYKLWSHIKKL